MKCVNCNAETTNPKFCSVHCSATYNNRMFPKRKITWTPHNCPNCGKLLDKYRDRGKIYCNQVCKEEHTRKLHNDKILNGSEIINLNKKYTRELLIETRGNKCEICGQLPMWKEKPLTLQLDHIDGNSDNNHIGNLRLLCPNCHTQTETWCKRTKKETRRNRYLRKFKGY